MPLALAAEGIARITGKEPRLTRDALRMAGYHMYFSSARARAAFGYTARPWQEGVRDALAWFRAEGRL